MAVMRWNGWRVYHETMGQGPPMLFIHGWSQSSRCWDAIAAELADSFRIMRLDLLGFGESDKPFNFSYSVENLALMVADFLNEQQVTGVRLVGHSLGGAVSLLASLLAPQCLSGLVLMNVPYHGPSSLLRMVGGVMFPELWYAIGQRNDLAVRAGAWLAKGDWSADACIEKDVKRCGALAAGRTARSVIHLDLRRAARQVTLPTLVIGGSKDRIVPRNAAPDLAAMIPDARLAVLQGVFHLPMMEAPLETARLLRAFATETSSAAARTA